MTDAGDDGWDSEDEADAPADGADGTPPDGRRTYTAVVDRFERGLAVLVVEKAEPTELVLDREALPPAGREQDAVLRVTYEDGELVDVGYDESETDSRRASAAERFDRLARRPPGSEDATSGEASGEEAAGEEAAGDDVDGD